MQAAARSTSLSPRSVVAVRCTVAVLLVIYALFLWKYAYIQPGGADSSGYFNLGRLLSAGHVHAPVRPLEGLPARDLPLYAYVPLGFVPTGDGASLNPTYPPGLPLLLAASSNALGWMQGPNALFVLHALVGVLLAYALARQAGASELGGWCTAFALAVAPLYFHHVLYAMSDMPATVWCALALWLIGRSGWCSAIGAGFAVGVAVLIRPSNALIALPMAILLGFDWRRWLAFGAGGLPAAAFLFVFNRAAYGAALASGYGAFGSLFSTEWLSLSLRHYAQWLLMAATPIVALALGLPFVRGRNWRLLLAHTFWIVTLFAFYAFYFHTHEAWWYLRFILPAVPSLLVLAILVAQQVIDRFSPRVALACWVGLAALALANANYWDKQLGLRHIGVGERVYTRIGDFVRTDMPPNAIVVAMQGSGALFYACPNPIVRWDNIDDTWPRIVASARQAGRPIYAILWDFERTDSRFAQNLPGRWTSLRTDGPATLWRYDGDTP